MSSPGVVKGNRPVQPWPEDYHTSVAGPEANELLKSTLTDETRTRRGDTKTCLFCGWTYYFRPGRCLDHLGLTGQASGSKKVQQCKPHSEHIDRHAQVVKELKERDEHEKIQAREVAKRLLESGQSDDPVDG